MTDDLIVITAHINSKEKEIICINLIKELRKQYNLPVYLASHIDIPKKISSEVDAYVVNTYNPILNYDIKNEFTKKYKSEINYFISNKSLKISYPIFHHGYAHLLSIVDGCALGLLHGYRKFHNCVYDLNLLAIKEIKKHQEYLNEHDCVFYNKTDGVNTEFFSVNEKKLQELIIFSKYDNYQKFIPVLEEGIELLNNQSQLIHKTLQALYLDKNEPQDNYGTYVWTSGKIQKSKIIQTFFKEYSVIPFLQKDKHSIFIGVETNKTKEHNLTIEVNGNIIYNNSREIVIYDVKLPTEVKIYVDDVLWNWWDLQHDNQFGTYEVHER